MIVPALFVINIPPSQSRSCVIVHHQKKHHKSVIQAPAHPTNPGFKQQPRLQLRSTTTSLHHNTTPHLLSFIPAKMTPTPTTLLRTMRPTFRSSFFTSTISTQKATFASRTAFRAARYKQAFAKRWASTAAGGEAAAQVQQSWVKRMWDSPIGLKTVHFW